MNFRVKIWGNGQVVETKDFEYLTDAQRYEEEVKRERGWTTRVQIVNLHTGHPM